MEELITYLKQVVEALQEQNKVTQEWVAQQREWHVQDHTFQQRSLELQQLWMDWNVQAHTSPSCPDGMVMIARDEYEQLLDQYEQPAEEKRCLGATSQMYLADLERRIRRLAASNE